MPRFEHPGFLTFLLWMTLPLLALIVFVAAWSFSSGDALGFGAFVHHVTGYDAPPDARPIGDITSPTSC